MPLTRAWEAKGCDEAGWGTFIGDDHVQDNLVNFSSITDWMMDKVLLSDKLEVDTQTPHAPSIQVLRNLAQEVT